MWALGYFGIGARAGPGAFDPSTALDAAIPFAGWAVWIYLGALVWIGLPALLLGPALFRRAALAYAVAIATALVCFALLPSTAPLLRAQASPAGQPLATAWALAALHRIDPPTNLLPSLHMALACLASIALAQQHPRWRTACWAALACIGLAVCLSKQHALADAAAGLLAGAASWAVAVRFTPPRRTLLPPA